MHNTMLVVHKAAFQDTIWKTILQNTYTILEANDFETAAAILENRAAEIDMILIDLIFCKALGFTVLAYRKHHAVLQRIPALVMTEPDAVKEQIQAFRMGATEYFTKPFVPEIVQFRLYRILKTTKQLQALLQDKENYQMKSELDQMTGLYNKTTTEHLITNILRTQPTQKHALLVFDADNFKSVNDTEGHLVGDHTIQILAGLLSSQFRKTDIVGRIGGDEFVVLMTDVPSETIVQKSVSHIIRILKEKQNLPIPEKVTMSVGIAYSNEEIQTYHTLFAQADQALYAAKQAGKCRYQEFGKESSLSNEPVMGSVLFYSRNRTNCNFMKSIAEERDHFIIQNSLEQAANVLEDNRKQVKLVYVDVSDRQEEDILVWNFVQSHMVFAGVPIVSICEEGNMQQYAHAIQGGVKDILSSPMSEEQVRSKMEKYCM